MHNRRSHVRCGGGHSPDHRHLIMLSGFPTKTSPVQYFKGPTLPRVLYSDGIMLSCMLCSQHAIIEECSKADGGTVRK